jgi:putative DNA primase/helicase
VNRFAHQTVRRIPDDIRQQGITDDRLANMIRNFAKHSESKYELDAMIDIAKSLDGIPITPGDCNRDPMLMNCPSGTIDLRTGALAQHRREDLITKMIPVRYDPTAKCPLWLKFLNRILGGDQAVIDFLQKAIGYSLTGSVQEKALFFLYGIGDNGKTTLLETIREMLGEYAGLAEIESFMHRSQDAVKERTIADLHGKRFATASESEEGQRFNESLIKSLTGMGRLTGRRLYSNSFEFAPEFKLFLDANYKPTIRGTDNAVWNRIRLIPFAVSIPKSEQDKELGKKLREELPGILAWAVLGCLKWRKEGLGSPKVVEHAGAAYRSEMDIVQEFLDECCEKDSDAKTPPATLYDAFSRWCEQRKENPIMASNAFGSRLEDKGYKAGRSAGSRWREGLRLKRPAEGWTM